MVSAIFTIDDMTAEAISARAGIRYAKRRSNHARIELNGPRSIAIALTKNTAIVGAIAANELLKVAGVIETRTASFDGYIAALIAFWCLTIPLAFVVSRIARRLKFAR